MARRWEHGEEQLYREQLEELYVRQNKTIGEIGTVLGIHQNSVYDRLLRLGIPTARHHKKRFCNQRDDVHIPEYSPDLAEFVGIMLGDGCLSHFQTMVTLGNKEDDYVLYVQKRMSKLFHVKATIITSKRTGYNVVYIGSTQLSAWLKNMGLVYNKVVAQVGIPEWIYTKDEYIARFLRGFFDTDGSFYLLRYGRQISLTNKSLPLLHSLRDMLIRLEFKPSEVSSDRVYLTRKEDIDRFFSEIQPANTKHLRRYKNLTRR